MNEVYVVLEMQTNGDQTACLTTTHTTLQAAQYQFHTVAAAAAISAVEHHSVALLNGDAFPIERIDFRHEVQE